MVLAAYSALPYLSSAYQPCSGNTLFSSVVLLYWQPVSLYHKQFLFRLSHIHQAVFCASGYSIRSISSSGNILCNSSRHKLPSCITFPKIKSFDIPKLSQISSGFTCMFSSFIPVPSSTFQQTIFFKKISGPIIFIILTYRQLLF